MAMRYLSLNCNFCCCVIEKSHERLLLAKGWKQFDVISDIDSLDIPAID